MGFSVLCADGSRGCQNQDEGGWSLRGNHIESGRANVPGSQVILELEVFTLYDEHDADAGVYIEFDYSVVHDILGRETELESRGSNYYVLYDTAKLEVLIDGKEVGREYRRGHQGTATIPIKSLPSSESTTLKVVDNKGTTVSTFKVQRHTILWVYTTAKHRTKLAGANVLVRMLKNAPLVTKSED